MSDKLLTEDELKIIRKTMAETEAQKKKQEDLKKNKKSVLDTTIVDIDVDTTNVDIDVDKADVDTAEIDTTKLDLTSLIPRIYSILTKEELDIIRKIIAKIDVKDKKMCKT
ncbi:MAG: hypothetical protein CL678_06050 [Bdellovibrionaceae bacterium]|nr:hypothetical protein [Pseudobdellovibrionaceae bacterium]